MAGPGRTPFDKSALLQVGAAIPQEKDGVSWANGQPTVKDGNTKSRLTKGAIAIEQGSTSARFYVAPQGVGIILIPPPGNSRETYNTQTHQYVNTGPDGDKTGVYPNGPPPGMMAKLAPFVQAGIKAIDQAKQTPDGAKWDDQYFRNVLKPYNSGPLPAPGPQVKHPAP